MSKKKPPISDTWKTRAANLKKLGFDVSVKGEWTEAKKKKIKKLHDEWGAIGANPKDFKKVSVKNLGPGALADLKDAGIKIKEGQAFLPLHGYDSAKIVTEYRKNKDGNLERIVAIKSKMSGRNPMTGGTDQKEKTVYLGSGLRQLDHLERLREEARQGKFKEGEFMHLQVYDNNYIANSAKLTVEGLHKYLMGIQWKNVNSENERESLRKNTHVARVWTSNPNQIAFQKPTSKKLSEGRKRTRNVRKTQFKGRGKK